MRKLIATFAVASSILLGGCATTGSITPDTITAGVAEVRKWTDTICSFIPTDATIRAIISSFTGGVDYVAVANGICDAVMTKSAVPGKRPTYRGVPIYGRRT